MTDTLLKLYGPDVPPYSARGLTQTLALIDASAKLRRTINADLIDVAEPQFRKYKSTVSCTDINVPAIEGLYPGAIVTVDCIAELSYLTEDGAPTRTAVEGSSRVEGAFTFYRPQLIMKVVTPVQVSVDEYQHLAQWSVDFEEA